MPKVVNERCLACVALASHEARQKSCWDGARCHKRRTFYRRKLAQPSEPVSDAVPVLDVPLTSDNLYHSLPLLDPNWPASCGRG